MYLPQYVNNSHCTLVDMFYIEQPIIMINTLDRDTLCKTKQCGSLHKKSCFKYLELWFQHSPLNHICASLCHTHQCIIRTLHNYFCFMKPRSVESSCFGSWPSAHWNVYLAPPFHVAPQHQAARSEAHLTFTRPHAKLLGWTGSDSWVEVASALLIPLEFVPLRVVPLDFVPLDVKPSSLSHFSVENINICFCKQWKFGFSTTQLVRVCSQSRFPAAPLGDRWNPTFSIFFFLRRSFCYHSTLLSTRTRVILGS